MKGGGGSPLSVQVQQRFPENLLRMIDSWAENGGISRTAAINIMCKGFLEVLEIENLRRENKELREKCVRLAMERVPTPRGNLQTLITLADGLANDSQ